MTSKRNMPSRGHASGRLIACVLAAAALAAAGCARHTTRPDNKPHPVTPPHTADQTVTNPSTPRQAVKVQAQTKAPASSPAPTVRKDAPLEYVVKKGDTLWDIAGYFLRDPWLWPQIWHANPYIANPNLIYPGDTLYLSYVNGRPQVRLRPGRVRLEPRVRREPLSAAIPSIPMSAIRPFLKGPRVVGLDTLKKAGYVVAFADNQLLASQGATVYAAHLGHKPESAYQVVHEGHAYRNPQTGKILGYEAIPTAQAELVAPGHKGEAATLNLTHSLQETSIGDRLLSTQSASVRTNFYPHAPKTNVSGQIISVFHGVSEIGRFQVVTLDLGLRDGLKPGSVLGIYQPGRKVPDPYHKSSASSVQLPPIKAGELMVFKASRHLSYALVMKSTRSIHVLDVVHKIHDS